MRAGAGVRALALFASALMFSASCSLPDDPAKVPTELSIRAPYRGSLVLDGAPLVFSNASDNYELSVFSDGLERHVLEYLPDAASGLAFSHFVVEEADLVSDVFGNPIIIDERKTSLTISVELVKAKGGA